MTRNRSISVVVVDKTLNCFLPNYEACVCWLGYIGSFSFYVRWTISSQVPFFNCKILIKEWHDVVEEMDHFVSTTTCSIQLMNDISYQAYIDNKSTIFWKVPKILVILVLRIIGTLRAVRLVCSVSTQYINPTAPCSRVSIRKPLNLSLTCG